MSRLRDLILAGGFAVGERLPASRTLARELGLSRTTVIEAFDRLTAEGPDRVARRRRGLRQPGAAGASARALPCAALVPGAARHRRGCRARWRRRWADSRDAPAAAVVGACVHHRAAGLRGLPDGAVGAPGGQALAQRRAHEVMGYGEPFGHAPLRQAIALHLRANRGIACDAEQIFIVGGAQQAFHLIGSTLLDPGDKVWFENPGAIGARNSLIASGRRPGAGAGGRARVCAWPTGWAWRRSSASRS